MNNKNNNDGYVTTFIKEVIENVANNVTWKSINAFQELVKRNVVTTVEIRNREIIGWISTWLADQEYTKKCTQLEAKLEWIDRFELSHVDDQSIVVSSDSGLDEQRLIFTPGRGNHFIKYDNQWIWIKRRKDADDAPAGSINISYDGPSDYYEVIIFGKSPNVLRDLIWEAKAYCNKNRIGKISVWKGDSYGNWNEVGLQDVRDLDSVYLDGNIEKNIVSDIEEFIEREVWYKKRGIPWTRGYIFYGPPGNGKTSFTKALASHFNMNLYVMNFDSSLTDDKLVRLFSTIRDRSIVLIEDIDKLFGDEDSKVIGVSYSGLLNAIDGIETASGRILIMTTNYKERLEGALIRPGRIDVHQYFGMATRSQMVTMFEKFYEGNFEPYMVDQFMVGFNDGDFSMAALQSYLLRYIDTPELAITNKDDIYKVETNGDGKENSDKEEESNEKTPPKKGNWLVRWLRHMFGRGREEVSEMRPKGCEDETKKQEVNRNNIIIPVRSWREATRRSRRRR